MLLISVLIIAVSFILDVAVKKDIIGIHAILLIGILIGIGYFLNQPHK